MAYEEDTAYEDYLVKQAWQHAKNALRRLTQNDSAEMREQIVDTASASGLFIIWCGVFAADSDMQLRLLEAHRRTKMEEEAILGALEEGEMENCHHVLSVARVSAKCSDMFSVLLPNGKEKSGYVPYDLGIGGGDYIRFSFCMNCMKIIGSQAAWPGEEEDFEGEESMEDEDEAG